VTSGTAPTAQPTLARRLAAALAAPLLLAVAFQSIGNLVFHAIAGRTLTLAEYGAAGAVLAVMTLVTVPLTALQTAASLTTAFGWGRATVRSTLARTTVGAAVLGVAMVALAPTVTSFFHLDSTGHAAMLAPYLAVSVVLAVARGQLLGDSGIRPVAASYAVGTGVRLVAGLALIPLLAVPGAIAATVLGEVAALVVAGRATWRRGGTGTSSSLDLRSVSFAAATVTGLFLFSTVDLLLARHYLDGPSSGTYVAAATIAKTVLALPAAVLGAHVPRLARAWQDGRPGQLRATLVTVGGLATLGAAVVALTPGLLLGLLYGPRAMAGQEGLVVVLAVVAALTSVVSVLTYAAIARRGWTVLVPWSGALLETLLIVAAHEDPATIATRSLVALVPTLLVMVALELSAWRRRACAMATETRSPDGVPVSA
jgi:O-antigen/teichoic acid export membrane protein